MMYNDDFLPNETPCQFGLADGLPSPAASAVETMEKPLNKTEHRVRVAFFLLCCFLLGAAGAGIA